MEINGAASTSNQSAIIDSEYLSRVQNVRDSSVSEIDDDGHFSHVIGDIDSSDVTSTIQGLLEAGLESPAAQKRAERVKVIKDEIENSMYVSPDSEELANETSFLNALLLS